MTNLALFTDASLNPHSKFGIGGFLFFDYDILKNDISSIDKSSVLAQLSTKSFNNISSTRLELMTILWGLDFIKSKCTNEKIINLKIYTDSQCAVGLLERRDKLERNSFISKNSQKELHNKDLYIDFYNAYDLLNFEIIKVKGHLKNSSHDSIHRIFSILDRELRRKLKNIINVSE